ncbi:MAG: transcription antitermination factor NusB [Microgenomates group bacterium]
MFVKNAVNSMDRRHEIRVSIVQQLYSLKFAPLDSSDSVDVKVRTILKVADEINKLITDAAPKFPLEKISRVDLSILQMAIYELVFEKKTPPKVIINEAIELAHEMGSEKTPGFINAVLGKIFADYEGH